MTPFYFPIVFADGLSHLFSINKLFNTHLNSFTGNDYKEKPYSTLLLFSLNLPPLPHTRTGLSRSSLILMLISNV